MKCRKWLQVWSIWMVLLFGIVGCSSTELEFYNLSKELSLLQRSKIYESKGELNLQLNMLPQSSSMEHVQKLVDAKKFLAQYSLLYSAQYDSQNDIGITEFYIKDRSTRESKLFTTLMRKDSQTYIQIDTVWEFIKDFIVAPDTRSIWEDICSTYRYVHITDAELIEWISATMSTASNPAQPIKMNWDPKTQGKQQQLLEDFMDGLIKEVYTQYQSKTITKEQNQYKMSLTADSIIPILESFIMYSLDHAEQMGTYVKNYIDAMDTQDMKIVGLSEDKKALYGKIDSSLQDVNIKKEEYKAAIQQLKLAQPQITQMLGETRLEMTLEKKQGDIYETTVFEYIEVLHPTDNSNKLIDFMLSIKDTTKEIKTLDSTVPTESMITFTALNSRFPKQVTIKMDQKTYVQKQGFKIKRDAINLQNIQGSAYIPLDMASELFGEDIQWDALQNNAYIVNNGNKFFIQCLQTEDITYIKIKDLQQENLNYIVQWDASTRSIIIKKLNKI